MLVRHDVEVGPGHRREVGCSGVVPKLEARTGSTCGTGPELGAHTEEVFEELLGLDAAAPQRSRDAGAL